MLYYKIDSGVPQGHALDPLYFQTITNVINQNRDISSGSCTEMGWCPGITISFGIHLIHLLHSL